MIITEQEIRLAVDVEFMNEGLDVPEYEVTINDRFDDPVENVTFDGVTALELHFDILPYPIIIAVGENGEFNENAMEEVIVPASNAIVKAWPKLLAAYNKAMNDVAN